jgi:excisionase family DNA binding protein
MQPLTITQAAKLKGVDRSTIFRWIKQQGLRADQFGEMWLIERDDLNKFTPRKAGRPAKEQTSNE